MMLSYRWRWVAYRTGRRVWLFQREGRGTCPSRRRQEKAGVSTGDGFRVLNNLNYKCSVSGPQGQDMEDSYRDELCTNEAVRIWKRRFRKAGETWYINIPMTRTDSSTTGSVFVSSSLWRSKVIHDKTVFFSKVWYMSRPFRWPKCRRENLDRLGSTGMYDEVEGEKDRPIITGRCKEASKKLNKKYKSVVSVNRNSTNYEVMEVPLRDGKKTQQRQWEYLISGQQNIGYIGQCHSEDRYNGYLEHRRSMIWMWYRSMLSKQSRPRPRATEAMESSFSRTNMPTGIYCAPRYSAIGMLCLNKFSNRLYALFDHIQRWYIEAIATRPMLTTVSLPKEDRVIEIYLLLD